MGRHVRRAAVLLALVLLAIPGCFGPFRAHVDADVLAKAPGWVTTPAPVQGHFPGRQSAEMRYSFDRNSTDAPPFAGTLQVFSIRGVDQLSERELLARAKDLVVEGADANSIALNTSIVEGTRTIANGVHTHWFVRYGATTQAGPVFGNNVGVRILGEVGQDGRSSTSVLVVAMAQVSRSQTCGILPTCTPAQESLATWIQMVGDGRGSVQGATTAAGFIDHLVTR